MFTMSPESISTLSDCHYQAHLEWEQVLADKNLRYYWKAYSRRLCDTEEYASDEMRGAVGMVLERRYGEKIRGWRARELFASQELARLTAKQEVAKVMQMAQQSTSWAEAHRSQQRAAQQEQLPFFEPGSPSGSHAARTTTGMAAQQVSMWPEASADERDDEDEDEADEEAEEPVGGETAATLSEAGQDDEQDETVDDEESALADAAAEARASSSRIVPKELVEEAAAFAAANPVPQCDFEAAIARQELATDAVPLSSWTAELLWTQSGTISLEPWWGVKPPQSDPTSVEAAVEATTEADWEAPHHASAEPQDEG